MLPMDSWRADFDERFPIYQQIVDRFCHGLVKGDVACGDRIPSIRDLALTLKVNTNTIQRAYQELERKQLIYSQRGTGYFVMEDDGMVNRVKSEMVEESTARFLLEMRALGFDDQQILAVLERQIGKGGDGNGAHADKGA